MVDSNIFHSFMFPRISKKNKNDVESNEITKEKVKKTN